jgi:hypothetical protein
MGIAAIVAGVLSLLFAIGAFIVSFVPVVGAFVGAFLAFAAPALALVGIVLGGVALSRARNEGGETGMATAGLVVSIVAFIPGFLVAISCGVCNSVCAAAQLENANNPRPASPFWLDAGPGSAVPPFFPPPPDPTALPPAPSADPNALPSDPNVAPVPSVPGDAPPPAFPPPPLEPAPPAP